MTPLHHEVPAVDRPHRSADSLSAPIPVSRPHVWGSESRRVVDAIERGWISSKGPLVEEFEQRFASWLGVPFAVATSNGTTALHLVLDAIGIRPGDEVIVPDFTMMAPVFAVLYCGAIPVPVDADRTWNLDPARVAERITPRTRAILAVHTYGHPVDLASLSEIARRHDILLIEDAAEGLGARAGGALVGTVGHAATFSLYANKTITTGEGGMVVTRDAALAARLRAKRDLCFGADEDRRFLHTDIGFNYRFTSLQAAFGLGQLEHVDEAVAAKRAIGERYLAGLADCPGLTLPPRSPWAENAYWVVAIVVDDESTVDRAALQQGLKASGIETRRLFAPVHEQPVMRERGIEITGAYPAASRLARCGCYLPSFIGMHDDEIDRVVQEVRRLVIGAGR